MTTLLHFTASSKPFLFTGKLGSRLGTAALAGSALLLSACTAPPSAPAAEESARTAAEPSSATPKPRLTGLARPQRPDRTRLVIYQSRQQPTATQPVYVYVNGEYQATSLSHTYTVVDVCTGPSRLATAVAGAMLQLLPATTQYLQLVALPTGYNLVAVTSDDGTQEFRGLPLQSHTLPRVDPNKCPPVMAADAPATVAAPPEITTPAPSFDRSDAASMLPEGRKRLAAIALEITAAKGAGAISVVGHTDPLGSDDYNLRLSAARAQTVANELVRGGVERSRMTAEGRGERDLLVTNCTSRVEQCMYFF